MSALRHGDGERATVGGEQLQVEPTRRRLASTSTRGSSSAVRAECCWSQGREQRIWRTTLLLDRQRARHPV